MRASVLFVITDLDVGGTEHHLVQVLPRLSRGGLVPFVYTLTPGSTLAPRLEAAGIEVLGPPVGSAGRRLPGVLRRLVLPLAAARLWWLLVRRRPSIVHLFMPEAYLLGGFCALLARQEIVVMSRRSLNAYQRRYPFLARLERRLHRRMTALIGNSRAVVADLAAEGACPERLALIYNGIDGEAYAASPPRADTRARLGIDPDVLVITTVANLIAYKGHEDLLVALATAADRLPTAWTLLCVGRDDGIGPALRARAAALGVDRHIMWLGERRDIPALLGASDLGVLASHEEGFSNAVLEGMAAGLPMIVTDAGGNPEAVTDDVTGVVVPARHPHALGAAIVALARDPARRARLGAAARIHVTATFSLATCVMRYERLYAGLHARMGTPVSALLPAEPPS